MEAWALGLPKALIQTVRSGLHGCSAGDFNSQEKTDDAGCGVLWLSYVVWSQIAFESIRNSPTIQSLWYIQLSLGYLNRIKENSSDLKELFPFVRTGIKERTKTNFFWVKWGSPFVVQSIIDLVISIFIGSPGKEDLIYP